MSEIFKSVFEVLLPRGSAWTPAPGKDFDKLLDGMSSNWQPILEFLEQLSFIRDPFRTPYLSDLEKEFGILTNENIDESIRRASLATIMFTRNRTGSEDDLEKSLRDAGFDVFVYQNDPAVDPALFLDQFFQMVADGFNAYAGRSDAFAGRVGGELLVNGEIIEQFPNYLMSADRESRFPDFDFDETRAKLKKIK